MLCCSPNRSTYLSPPLSPGVPKAAAVQVFLHPPDTMTGNGLRCFPTPVNKLPACEGIDGFDIRCCLTQKRCGSPWDGPIPHTAHPSCEAIEWMGYKASPWGGEEEQRDLGRRRGCQASPSDVGGGNDGPAYHIPPLRVFNFYQALLSGSITF